MSCCLLCESVLKYSVSVRTAWSCCFVLRLLNMRITPAISGSMVIHSTREFDSEGFHIHHSSQRSLCQGLLDIPYGGQPSPRPAVIVLVCETPAGRTVDLRPRVTRPAAAWRPE